MDVTELILSIQDWKKVSYSKFRNTDRVSLQCGYLIEKGLKKESYSKFRNIDREAHTMQCIWFWHFIDLPFSQLLQHIEAESIGTILFPCPIVKHLHPYAKKYVVKFHLNNDNITIVNVKYPNDFSKDRKNVFFKYAMLCVIGHFYWESCWLLRMLDFTFRMTGARSQKSQTICIHRNHNHWIETVLLRMKTFVSVWFDIKSNHKWMCSRQ